VTTFTIPSPSIESVKSKGFSLNDELIRILTEETRQVKGVLAEIFIDQEEDSVENDTTVAISPDERPLSKLDQPHQDFFQHLLQQEYWERSALHVLCKELELMLDGAMEVLNEWSFENANATLIEDGDPVCIDLTLAREIINDQ
ncbi:MAG: hypothetical protein GX811_06140, partial [Lentisphaerae bacterium]|nr:hypothetical protein [Lentisphaerota bacterium]